MEEPLKNSIDKLISARESFALHKLTAKIVIDVKEPIATVISNAERSFAIFADKVTCQAADPVKQIFRMHSIVVKLSQKLRAASLARHRGSILSSFNQKTPIKAPVCCPHHDGDADDVLAQDQNEYSHSPSSPPSQRSYASSTMRTSMNENHQMVHMLGYLAELRDIESLLEELFKEIASAQQTVSSYIFNLVDKRIFMDTINSALSFASIVSPYLKTTKSNYVNLNEVIKLILSIHNDQGKFNSILTVMKLKKKAIAESSVWSTQVMPKQFMGICTYHTFNSSDIITSAMRLCMDIVGAADSDLTESNIPSSSLALIISTCNARINDHIRGLKW